MSHVIINKRYINIDHVKPIRKVGTVFPKDGVTPIAFTSEGRVPLELSQAGEFCRIHESFIDARMDGDAFVYDDGSWIMIDLATVEFISKKSY